MNLTAFREKYPEYKNWSDQRLTSAIDMKHAKEGIPASEKGWTGIGNDIVDSLSSAPDAIGNLIS